VHVCTSSYQSGLKAPNTDQGLCRPFSCTNEKAKLPIQSGYLAVSLKPMDLTAKSIAFRPVRTDGLALSIKIIITEFTEVHNKKDRAML